jgi:hypothetical protein
MIPTPSKRPFGHPLQPDALAFFCHPRHSVFLTPVRHPDGAVYAASGYACIRVSRGPIVHDDSIPAATPEFLSRVDALPWDRFIHDPARSISPPAWRSFDDARGTIYRDGTLDLWPAGRMTEDTPVLTAGGPLIPLALLQLAARLPKAEAMLVGDRSEPLFIRFSGGECLIPPRWRHAKEQPRPKFALFARRDTSGDLQAFRF